VEVDLLILAREHPSSDSVPRPPPRVTYAAAREGTVGSSITSTGFCARQAAQRLFFLRCLGAFVMHALTLSGFFALAASSFRSRCSSPGLMPFSSGTKNLHENFPVVSWTPLQPTEYFRVPDPSGANLAPGRVDDARALVESRQRETFPPLI